MHFVLGFLVLRDFQVALSLDLFFQFAPLVDEAEALQFADEFEVLALGALRIVDRYDIFLLLVGHLFIILVLHGLEELILFVLILFCLLLFVSVLYYHWILSVPIDERIHTSNNVFARYVYMDHLAIAFLKQVLIPNLPSYIYVICMVYHVQHFYIDEESQQEGFATLLLVYLLFIHEILALVLQVKHTACIWFLFHVALYEIVVSLNLFQVLDCLQFHGLLNVPSVAQLLDVHIVLL